MDGGSYNRIIGLEFAKRQPQKYILRIPINGRDWDRSAEIKDQVACLHYLSQFHGIPVASIFAFDATKDNVIGSPYVLQQRLPGTCLESVYYGLPIAEKLQIVTGIAALILKMETVKIDKPGRVTAYSTFASKSFETPNPEMIVRISPYSLEKEIPDEKMAVLEAQPLPSLLQAMLAFRKNLAKDDDMMCPMWEDLERITAEMEDAGLFPTTDNNYTLWHWDFAARNILT